MTETSIAVTMIPPEVKNTKTGTSGTLCIGTTMKIVDVETGENVTMKGTPGEMCVTGPQVKFKFFNQIYLISKQESNAKINSTIVWIDYERLLQEREGNQRHIRFRRISKDWGYWISR